MKALRILIADDHELVRRGIRSVMEAQTGWEVCGEAPTGRHAVEQAKRLKPDVVILDISMPELNGLDATRQILKALPKTEILVFTIHESEQVEREVLSAGARGYLLKSDGQEDLVTAVDNLGRHRPFFTTRIATMALESYLRDGLPARQGGFFATDPLTPREREVIQLLAEGKSNKEVANLLHISLKTAQAHRSNILRKLHMHSLSDLVHYAIRNNMVEA